MYRCEDCEELFTSALDLQRHQKYCCAGSLSDTLSNEDFKQDCDDSDHESVHECKDCEKIFPDEYRCSARTHTQACTRTSMHTHTHTHIHRRARTDTHSGTITSTLMICRVVSS